MEIYELINSEGAILTLEVDNDQYVFNFEQEKLTYKVDEITANLFVAGKIAILSPSGKSYDLFLNGDWRGMIQHKEVFRYQQTPMTKTLANKIYDILVDIGGAPERDREYFLYHHTSNEPCGEWRFCGKLGFGGKFRSDSNRVDCYQEDMTPERMVIISEINNELSKLK